MASSCFGQASEREQAATDNSAEFPLVQSTNDLAWLLTFEMNVGQLEVARIQTLLNPRDPEINPNAPEPDFEQAEQVCREWFNRTDSSDARVLLAAIRFERGDSATALIVLTEVIVQDPSDWKALWIRSQVLHAAGQIDEAQADAKRMADAIRKGDFGNVVSEEGDFPWDPLGKFDAEFGLCSDPHLLILLVPFHFVVYIIVCLRCGRRQRREAGGTWRRLLAVSLWISLLWTLPVLTAAVLLSVDIGNPPGLFWWVLLEFLTFLLVRAMVNPPTLSYVGKEPLPQCDDSEMLARVEALAKRIGVVTPTVRSQRALNLNVDSAAAFVGGLAPHSVVLYDTVLAQLKVDEQDAVIGHELGHIANRSIWVYVTVYPLAAVAMVVLSFLGGGYFGVIAGMALYVGTFRALSRRFEYDCDRRSALATSPDAMARGLRRIYARHPLGKPGLLTSIVHSMATHPSLDERIHALSKLASSGECGSSQSVSVDFSDKRVRLCRKLVWFFALAWLSLTAFGIAGRLLDFGSGFSICAVHAAAFGPLTFTLLAMRRPARILALRSKGRFRWVKLKLRQQLALISILLLTVLGTVGAVSPDLIFPEPVPGQPSLAGVVWAVVIILLVGMILLGGLSKPKPRRYRKLTLEMTAAFQRNDFQRVLDVCDEHRNDVETDKFLRQNEAAALIGTGEFDRCVECFENLIQDEPHFPLASSALAAIYIDQGNLQRALDLTRTIEKDLHKLDPMPPLLAARALRGLGRGEEARAECDRAAKLAPDDVSVMAVAASLALDFRNREKANQIIDLADSLLPAEPLLIVARGERAILDGDLDALQKEHDALAASLDDDRLLNLRSDLAKLAAALPTEQENASAPASLETPSD